MNDLIDYSQYTQFDCPIIGYPLYPDDLSQYPLVVQCNDEKAIIALSPKRGFILHKDGSKSPTENLQKLVDSDNKMSVGGRLWARDMMLKMIKEDTLKD
jgi:hypothetical protein